MSKRVKPSPVVQLGWAYFGAVLCLGMLSQQLATIQKCIAELEQETIPNEAEIKRLKALVVLCETWKETIK